MWGTVADWAMVAITGGAVWAALRSLESLKQQTLIAKDTADAALLAAQATQLAERAYVSMSHVAPGLTIVQGDPVTIRCKLAVENKGSTPARILDAQITAADVVTLPTEPPYAPPSDVRTTAYLVKDEKMYIDGMFGFTLGVWQQIQAGERTLLLLGYVDYVDVFGHTYRSGYARRYALQPVAGNNLLFETAVGYNYDRQLTP